ncbi:hypothetical protein N9176_02505, partial [bacterium]|nr:hypothetical protein [bacterium]
PASYDLKSLDMWADWRAKVDDLSSDDVLILGSSRGHFDLNIHLWDSITGNRPVMLAYPGSSPLHTIEDVIENSTFNGLLIISIAPGLFYTMKGSWGAGRGKDLVDHYYNRTYAQQISSIVYKIIDPLFSYTQGGDLNLKGLIERIPFQNRDSVRGATIWPPMVAMDKYRNIRMLPEMENDSIIQKQQTDIWYNPNPKNRFADSIDVVIGHYVNLVEKHKEKGGRVAFIRPPVTDYYLETETRLYPREKYWDRLILESSCPGYHFQDYEETKYMIPPEWSHLNRRDADAYTKTIIQLLTRDQLQ